MISRLCHSRSLVSIDFQKSAAIAKTGRRCITSDIILCIFSTLRLGINHNGHSHINQAHEDELFELCFYSCRRQIFKKGDIKFVQKGKPGFPPFQFTPVSSRMRNLHVDRGAERGTGVDSIVTELLLDTEDLVELGKTLRSGGSTSLDLTGTETDNDVSNGDILSLTGTVRNHDTPGGSEGVLGSLDGLGDGTDLVDLEEKGVASLGLDGLLDERGVGDSQVITDNLLVVDLTEVSPGLPVILSEGVLDGDNGVLGSELLVLVGELLVGNPLLGVGLGVLEVKIVLLGVNLVELGRGNIHGDVHLASVAGLLDGLSDKLESLLGGLNVGSDTTLVTNVTSGLAVLLLGERLEGLVDLSTPAHGLGEGRSISARMSHTMFD
jgi:hypothetical protein